VNTCWAPAGDYYNDTGSGGVGDGIAELYSMNAKKADTMLHAARTKCEPFTGASI